MNNSISAASEHDEGGAAIDDAHHRASVPTVGDRGGVKRGQKELVIIGLRLQMLAAPSLAHHDNALPSVDPLTVNPSWNEPT